MDKRSTRQWMLGAVFLLLASVAAWQTVRYTNAANENLDQISEDQNFGNEGSQALAKFVNQHRIVGSYIASDLQRDFKMPSFQASSSALSEVPALGLLAAQQEALASRWSWLLLGLCAAYLALAAVKPKAERVRSLLFALTSISAVFFAVGISACALEVFTVISHFFGTTPVLQHQIRSIASVIGELFSTGHWIFAGFIVLFSVITPLTKIVLTYLATLTSSSAKNLKISKFLKAIGKWSMADVFVAAILLACYTLKSGQGTQVIPCRGLYYFAGYCLVSMITTSVLTKINFTKEEARLDSEGQIGIPVLGELVGIVLFLSAIYGLR
jgi:paraquat-inducible protein A